jgi:hypothetical protein
MFYLYLKVHNITGLKYLGYTSRDPFKYNGSGKYWLRHIKKHGYDISTTILGQYDNMTDVTKNGLYYSNKWDVVESSDFANLKEEAGFGGSYGKATRRKMSENYNYEADRWSSERRKRQSEMTIERNKKLWSDPEYKEKTGKKISDAVSGVKRKPRSEEFKNHMSKVLTGRSYGKGIKHQLKLVECPHCGKEGRGPNMTRYHFHNCKTLLKNNDSQMKGSL